MIKTKVFHEPTAQNLEAAMNLFLATPELDYEFIDIKYQYTEGGFTTILIYEEYDVIFTEKL